MLETDTNYGQLLQETSFCELICVFYCLSFYFQQKRIQMSAVGVILNVTVWL